MEQREFAAEQKSIIKDRIFFGIVKAVFYVIYGYFNPPGTMSSYQLFISHRKLKDAEDTAEERKKKDAAG